MVYVHDYKIILLINFLSAFMFLALYIIFSFLLLLAVTLMQYLNLWSFAISLGVVKLSSNYLTGREGVRVGGRKESSYLLYYHKATQSHSCSTEELLLVYTLRDIVGRFMAFLCPHLMRI